VEEEVVVKVDDPGFGNNCYEGGFGLFNFGCMAEAEAVGDAVDMGVDGHDGLVEGGGEDDIGGFSADSGELFELFSCFGDFPCVLPGEDDADGADVLCFVVAVVDAADKLEDAFGLEAAEALCVGG